MRPQAVETTDVLLQRWLPLFDAPAGELPDPELVAALGEGLLTPAEEAEAVAAIRHSPAARIELRDVYPEVFARHFGHEIPRAESASEGGAKVLAFPARRRVAAISTLAVAAAAAIALFAIPPSPPESSDLTMLRGVRSGDTVRGGEAEAIAIAPGEKIDLLMKLGTPGTLDSIRGARPWGALFAVDASGRARLVCTHDDAQCKASDKTMAYLFTAPRDAGTTWFFFVAAPNAVEAADLGRLVEGLEGAPAEVATALQRRLDEAAGEHHWKVHAQRPLRVGEP
jgi:hypothetical protein